MDSQGIYSDSIMKLLVVLDHETNIVHRHWLHVRLGSPRRVHLAIHFWIIYIKPNTYIWVEAALQRRRCRKLWWLGICFLFPSWYFCWPCRLPVKQCQHLQSILIRGRQICNWHCRYLINCQYWREDKAERGDKVSRPWMSMKTLSDQVLDLNKLPGVS